MIGLLVHTNTARQLAHIQSGSTHAVLLVGDAGMGKKTIARRLVANLLGVTTLNNQPYVMELGATPGESIGVEQIRELRKFLQRKTTGTARIRRACLLLGVETMTAEASNALLKTLEEPPEDTLIVLTATNESTVPLTVRSRVQVVSILPVSLDTAREYAGFQSYSVQDVQRAHRLAGGRPALMSALLEQSDEHSMAKAIALAKQMLAASPYERLCQVDIYAKDKQATEALLTGLERIAESIVDVAATQSDTARLKRAHKTLLAVSHAQDALSKSASTKLVLTNLFVNM